MFWTLFSFPRTDVLWTDMLQALVFHGHGPDTLRFSTDGQFSTDYRSSGHFSKSNHSSDSSQTSKKPPASKLLEFDLGHLRDGTWNISGDMGLVSAGRINKDTPPLTTPSHTSKSSAMDISSHIFQIEIHGATQRRFRRGRGPTSYDMRPEAYLYARKMREGKYHRFLARILT